LARGGTQPAGPTTLRDASKELAKEDAMPGLSGRMSTVIKAKISLTVRASLRLQG
jgi:hypothetical protein